MSRIRVTGLDQVLVNMKNAPKNIRRDLLPAVGEATEHLVKRVRDNAGLVDEHSLEKLARMGHPYGKNKSVDFPHEDYLIHKQSGELYANIESEIHETQTKITMMVGVKESKVKYIRHLIYGTSRMRPRDFLSATWEQEKDKVLKIIKFGITTHVGSRKGVTGKK